MKRFLRCTLYGLVPATLAALVLGASSAATGLALRSATLSCSDGTALNLALDTKGLSALSSAVSPINLNPAGNPALACSLTGDLPSSSANRPKDYAVGGGQVPFLGCDTNFSLSAHSDADALATGVGGTYNVTLPGTPPCALPESRLVSTVDCVKAEDDDHGSGTAQATARVTYSDGIFASLLPVGSEVRVDVLDSSMPGDVGDMIGVAAATDPCDFSSGGSYCSGLSPCGEITRGDIDVHED